MLILGEIVELGPFGHYHFIIIIIIICMTSVILKIVWQCDLVADLPEQILNFINTSELFLQCYYQ